MKNPLEQTKTKIESFGGYKLSPIGTVSLKCKIKETIENVKFMIIDHDKFNSILGLNTCMNYNLVKRVHKCKVEETSDLNFL